MVSREERRGGKRMHDNNGSNHHMNINQCQLSHIRCSRLLLFVCFLSVIASGHMRALPEKCNAGEDAFFIAEDSSDGSTFATGVADGVGGWSAEGIDAGLYARELMENAKAASLQSMNGELSPKQVLKSAHAKMDRRTKGSCTACIVSFDGDELRYANLGDSGLFGWRFGRPEPFIRTQEQQHSWNCPYQLGHNTGDRPDLAKEGRTKVKQGDIIVLATDGFFDNLFNKDIMEVISEFVEQRSALLARQASWPPSVTPPPTELYPAATASASSNDPNNNTQLFSSTAAASFSHGQHAAALHTHVSQVSKSIDGTVTPTLLNRESLKKLAELLVDAASKAAEGRAETPFSKSAQSQGKRYRGGKPDDITVVVAQVQSLEARDKTVITATSIKA